MEDLGTLRNIRGITTLPLRILESYYLRIIRHVKRTGGVFGDPLK